MADPFDVKTVHSLANATRDLSREQADQISELQQQIQGLQERLATSNRIPWGRKLSELVALINDLAVCHFIDTHNKPAEFIVDHFANEDGTPLDQQTISREHRRQVNEKLMPTSYDAIRIIVRRAELSGK